LIQTRTKNQGKKFVFSFVNLTLQSLRIYHYTILPVFFSIIAMILAMTLVILSNDNHPFVGIQVAKAQTFHTSGTIQMPGLTQQTSGNISGVSSLSLSEYNNSKYGFRIQYPSDWQVISIANSSLSSSFTGTPSEVIARIRSPSGLQQGTQDLVTISVENLSAASHQQANDNLSAYDYAAPIIRQLPLMLDAAAEPNQTILIKNESLDIRSNTNGKESKNLSAWRIDYITSDYKSDVFFINDTKLFDIGFSTPKERATQSVPIFDKLLNSIQFISMTGNATSDDIFGDTDIKNATAASNQTINTSETIPLSQIFEQGARPQSELLQQGQKPQQQALLVPPFSVNPSESQPQQSEQMLSQQQPPSQPPFSAIQPSSQQQPLELLQPLPLPWPQQPYTTLPPSAPLYPLPSIPPSFGPAYNYPSPMILSQYPYLNNSSSVQIVGQVLNQAPVAARFVKIIATFYDSYGQVIGTDSTYTDPSDLAPGQRAPFNMIVQEESVPIYQMTNYALNIDWRL
jgi:hypothetical protein